MSKFMGFIVGALEIAAGIYLEFVPGGQAIGWYLIAGGAGAIIGNIGTLLSQPQGGLGTASRNPVMPWNVVYGQAKVGGTIVYINSFGDSDKYLDIVFVLACHPCKSIDALLFDNQRILIDAATNTSVTPTQQTMNISAIVRAYGVVTVYMVGVISDLQPGDKVQIQNVSGVTSIDRSLNGVVYVYEVLSSTSFTFLSGGLDITLGATGQVQTMWPDYRSKVYCEFLTGDHTSTFNGMIFGTPNDGDGSDLIVPDYPPGNPWTQQHVLNGRACAMLRLHYNDEVFSSGLPQISFRLRGKKDIYDPRNNAAMVWSPTVLLNGWGNNAHEGPYEGGVDLGYTWGLNDDVTQPYGGVSQATDGNPTSFCVQSYRHTHEYAGCVWVFPAIAPTSPVSTYYLSILTAVPSSGPGSLRSAGMYYSLDGGTTWTQIYDQATRAQQWDNVTLPTGQDTSQVQVMAFMDSHDDMTHIVYEIRLGNSPASDVNGYTENAALCVADYLANTTFGFKAEYGTEIPLAPLITAANICDEDVPLASGETEPRYQCNGNFSLNTSRGEILQNMLTACGGRITYSSGQFIIWPAHWPGVSLIIGSRPVATATMSFIIEHICGTGMTGQCISSCVIPWGYTDDIPLFSSQSMTFMDGSGGSQATHTETCNWLGPYPEQTPNQWSMTLNNGWIDTSYTAPRDTIISFYIFQSLSGDAAPPDIYRIYDCWIDVTYTDGITDVLRPTEVRAIHDDPSWDVTGEGSLLDGRSDTYCEISRHHFGPPWNNRASVQIRGFKGIEFAPPAFDSSTVLESQPVLGITSGPFTWRSKVPIRELYNGCKGMYISPANGWQNSDFPPYAQDADHGYSGPADFEGDQNLADDGGDRRWLEIQLPFTISPFAAQRLAKIELMRRRQQGQGTFSFNMSLYKTTALDIVSMTLPILGWTEKLLEVSAHRLAFNRGESGPTLGCELDVQETDPSVYDWNVSEQLAAQGVGLGVLPSTSNTGAPTGAAASSSSATSIVGADGIARSRIEVTWTPPADAFVANGGHIEIQYRPETSPAASWIMAGNVDPSVTTAFIDGVTDGVTYDVQIRAVNAAGSPGDWVSAAPVTVSGATSVIPPANIAQGGASDGDVLVWSDAAGGWIPGATSAGALFVTETPMGVLNGSNTLFTVTRTPIDGSFMLLLNGVEQIPGLDYSQTGVECEYVVAPQANDFHVAFYSY